MSRRRSPSRRSFRPQAGHPSGEPQKVAAFGSEWVAAFPSEWVAAFTSESLAGFARNTQEVNVSLEAGVYQDDRRREEPAVRMLIGLEESQDVLEVIPQLLMGEKFSLSCGKPLSHEKDSSAGQRS
jgi:hypothetical protein